MTDSHSDNADLERPLLGEPPRGGPSHASRLIVGFGVIGVFLIIAFIALGALGDRGEDGPDNGLTLCSAYIESVSLSTQVSRSYELTGRRDPAADAVDQVAFDLLIDHAPSDVVDDLGLLAASEGLPSEEQAVAFHNALANSLGERCPSLELEAALTPACEDTARSLRPAMRADDEIGTLDVELAAFANSCVPDDHPFGDISDVCLGIIHAEHVLLSEDPDVFSASGDAPDSDEAFRIATRYLRSCRTTTG